MIERAKAELGFEQDIIKTSAGDLKITFIGHGTLMFMFEGKVIHVDPPASYVIPEKAGIQDT